ncbi:GNAT family N-acetyltransferase [Flavisolibacter sp. BT320]|nr:GNAT family N-acetyltransferase [Flavisolibacter longurius]
MHHSERLLFDRPKREDFERFYAIHSDPQTNLFNPNGPLNLERSGEAFNNLIRHWEEHHFGSWTIKLNNAPAVIAGFGGLSYRLYGDEVRLNLGYRFDKDFWGRGYATELSLHAIRFGFSELNADSLFALVRPNHAASIKVLEKCGLQLIGTLDDVPGEEQSLIYRIEKNFP